MVVTLQFQDHLGSILRFNALFDPKHQWNVFGAVLGEQTVLS